MASRRTIKSQPPAPPLQTREDIERGIRRLTEALNAVEAFNQQDWNEDNEPRGIVELRALIQSAVEKAFPEGSSGASRYSRAHFLYGNTGSISFGGRDYQAERNAYSREFRETVSLLKSAIAELRRDLEDLGGAPIAGASSGVPKVHGDNVFIVHGHDNEPKEAVARLLPLLGLNPIILHEQANKGRTLIQKFREVAADAGFAVVLLTPDDQMADGRKRARQNVILELGFFLGALGPERVVAIVKGDVERPSDFDGVVYLPYDAGWKAALATELDAAGYEFDWNALRGNK